MLRIIAGEFRTRRIETPPDATKTRPIPDRVRTALFNMLSGHFEGELFVDAFAGTGSFGLEALSRGAEHCVFIERDREIAQIIRRNIELLGVEDRSTLLQGDALGSAAIAACPRQPHVVFFDPPYPLVTDPRTRQGVFEQFQRFINELDPTGFAILRTPHPFLEPRVEDEPAPTKRGVDIGFEAQGPESHAYGSTVLHWYMRREDDGAGGASSPGVG
jgi:16S rRNA (guanine(966)-N(2))-methyltransferase RsmD